MKLLLTSAGITNSSIRAALLDLLGKPIEQCTALAIPTAAHAHPMIGAQGPYRFIAGLEPQCPMTGLGWASIGVLELTALASVGDGRWKQWVRDADVLLVDGGDATFLAHWVRESGLLDLIPELDDLVWVGLSAGSMVMAPRIGEEFVEWQAALNPTKDDGLGLVDFAIFPHLEHPALPWNTLDNAEKWAAKLEGPAYAIDDHTAIAVVDGRVDVISEGRWQQLQ